MRRHLLGPLERRVAGVRPTHREVGECVRSAPLVDVRELRRHVADNAVESEHLVVGAVRARLRRSSRCRRRCRRRACCPSRPCLRAAETRRPDLVVGVLAESREGLHLASEQALLIHGERVPRRDLRRTRGELRSRGHDPHLDLPRQGLLAKLVPALIELAFVLRDPFLRARGAARAWRRSRSTCRTASRGSAPAGSAPRPWPGSVMSVVKW